VVDCGAVLVGAMLETAAEAAVHKGNATSKIPAKAQHACDRDVATLRPMSELAEDCSADDQPP
jgi:hypothetical protein